MVFSAGFTVAEIRECVYEYESQPHGGKGVWLEARGVSMSTLRRWRDAMRAGDLDRGLVPREGSGMSVPPDRRSLIEQRRAAERDDHAAQIAAHVAEIARLSARVEELAGVNEALGKAIGLLHEMNEHEPDEDPTRTDPSDS